MVAVARKPEKCIVVTLGLLLVRFKFKFNLKLPLAVPVARVPASNYPVKYLDLTDLLSNDYNGHGGC